MPNVTIRTGELPKFSRKLFEQLSKALSEKVGTEAKTEVQKRIKAVNAIASRQFLHSVTATVRKSTSRNFLVSVGSDDRAASSIEEGLKPTKVPIIKIYQWMRDKGIERNAAFAYYVRNKLAEQGYEGRHVFEDAEENLLKRLDDLIEEILNEEDFFEK